MSSVHANGVAHQSPRSRSAPWEINTPAIANPNGVAQTEAVPMGQSLVQLYVHVVFSTKNRTPFLKDSASRERLHAYLVGICKNQKCAAIKIGGVEDHVHLLVRLGKTMDVSSLVRELKRDSSEWVKKELSMVEFYWQSGYGAFPVSPSHVDKVTAYVANQVEHHQTVTFQDEFRRLCKIYGVEIDERYVWE